MGPLVNNSVNFCFITVCFYKHASISRHQDNKTFSTWEFDDSSNMVEDSEWDNSDDDQTTSPGAGSSQTTQHSTQNSTTAGGDMGDNRTNKDDATLSKRTVS